MNSRGVGTPDAVSANLIEKVNVNCRLSPSFKESLNKAEFVPAEKFK